PNSVVLCEGATLALTATSIPGARYTWQCPTCPALPCTGQDSIFFRPGVTASPCYSGTYTALIEIPGCGTYVRSANVQVLEWPNRINIEGTSTLCEGQEIRLKTLCLPQASYQWVRNGNIIATSNSCELTLPASTSNAGCYTVTIIPPSGSSNFCLPVQSAAFCVAVKPRPNLQLTSGKLSYCKGEEVSLQAELVPAPSQNIPIEFNWIFPYTPTPPPGKGATITFRAQQSGIYKYQVNVEGCGILESSLLPIVVDEIPTNLTIIPSNAVLCPGTSNFSLRIEPPLPGGEFTWQGPNSTKTFAKVTSDPVGKIELGPTITPADSGNYTVLIEKGACSGNFARILSTNVNILRQPTITLPETIRVCKGSPLNITANLGPGFNPSNTRLNWIPLGGVQARDLLNFNSFTRANMQPNDAGDYIVEIRVGNCAIQSHKVQVTVVDWPTSLNISGPTSPICVSPGTSAAVTLAVPNLGSTSEVTYLWQGPHPNASAANNTPFLNLTNLSSLNSGVYTARVKHQNCGSELSANFLLNVINVPQLELSPSQQTICGTNGSASLCVRPKDGGILPENLIYRWQFPATSTRNATNILDCLNMSGISRADSGDYFVRVTFPGCPTQNLRATINVLTRIEPLVANPGLINTCVGEQVIFSVSPNRNYLQYTWRKNGSLISPPVEGAVLVIPAVKGENAGFYTIEASLQGLNCPNLTSATSITLRVDSLPSKVTIQSLLGNPVCSTSGASFKIAENLSIPPYSVQWYRPGENIPFTTGNVAFDPTPRSGLYRVRISVAGCQGKVLEDTLRIQVSNLPGLPPNFPTQLTMCSGSRLAFNYFSTPCNGCRYRWSGPNNFHSTFPNPVVSDSASIRQAGTYRLILSAAGCDSIIREINVTVNSVALDLNVTSNSPLCEGQTLQFTVRCANCQGVNFQWNGPSNFSSTLQNPTLTNAKVTNSGSYILNLRVAGCTEAIPILVPVEVNPLPVINLPAETTFCKGQVVRLSNLCTNPRNCNYAWQTSGKTFNTAELVFNPIQTSDAGLYNLEITAPGCRAVSGSILVRVTQIDTPRVVPNKPTLCLGESLRFTASPSQPRAEYEWSGPVTIPNNRQLIPGIINNPQRGNYILKVNLPGSPCPPLEISTPIEVNPIPATPVINTTKTTFCSGESIRLVAVEGGLDPISLPGTTYLWFMPNQEQPQGTNPLVISNASPANSGTYSVIAIANGCSSRATTINLRVEPTPAPPRVISKDTAFCEGGVARLSVASITGATYFWQGPGILTPSQKDQVIASLPSGKHTYTLLVTVGNCATDTSIWKVNVYSRPTLTLAPNLTICQGQPAIIPILNKKGSYPLRIESNISSLPFFVDSTQNNLVLPATLITSSREITFTRVIDANRCTSTLSATTLVQVENKPSAPVFAAIAPICEGNNLNLVASAASGLNFYWWGPLGVTFTSTLPSWNRGSAKPEMSGEYKLVAERKVNDKLSCFSDTARITVRVEPIPQVTFSVVGSSTPCTGDSIRFRVEFTRGNPGFRFNFSPLGRIFSLNQNTVEFSAFITSSTPQQYSISQIASSVGIVGSTGCLLTSPPPQPIVIQPQPGLSPTAIRTSVQHAGCSGTGTVTLSVTASGNLTPTTYELLDLNRNLVEVVTSPSFRTVNPGKYIIKANLTNGCATHTAPITVFGPPSNLSIERLCDARNTASLRIGWSNPLANETGQTQNFYVRIRKKGTSTWQCITARNVQSTEATPNVTITLGGVCNLQPDSSYEVQVVATNNPAEVSSNNNIPWGSCLSEFVFRSCSAGGGSGPGGGGNTICAIPDDFRITSVTSGDASFAWSNASGVSLFEFEAIQTGIILPISKELVPASRNRHTVSLPYRQVDYTFRVTPVCPDGSRGTSKVFGPVRTPRLENTVFDQTNITVYPNPTQGPLNIHYQGLQIGQAAIKIMDIQGKILFTSPIQILEEEGTIEIINLSLPKGIYTLIFEQANYLVQLKLIVVQ
ncbi:MAG: T9SS type A sorting domain-containing protein, partial [Bacteroidia bacterium]|nr:T9SS type A sorting domain-containing protein [Bacteroidia bacterium]